MTKEDRNLLMKDLCARLPYGVICDTDKGAGHLCSIDQTILGTVYGIDVNPLMRDYFEVHEIKPYLRPMSSMTEKEIEELKSKCTHNETEEDWDGVRSDVWCIQILEKYDTRRWDNSIVTSTIHMDAIDWLNSHHFDYRNLIEKGLALEAPEDMYDLNNERK